VLLVASLYAQGVAALAYHIIARSDVGNTIFLTSIFFTLSAYALSALSQKSATVAENGETTAKFAILRQSLFLATNRRTFLRQCEQAFIFLQPGVRYTTLTYLKHDLCSCDITVTLVCPPPPAADNAVITLRAVTS